MGVGFTLFFLTGASGGPADAQNVFRVQFDTVTIHASDTAEVNVNYTFVSTHSHTIDHYQLRLQYDSSEVSPLDSTGYDLAGTASGMFFDTTTSFLGIIAQGQSELDLTNPVLLRIRFRVNPRLADTAFIRWDTLFNLFDSGEGVDQTIRQDGWIRTPSVAGHVVLSTPPITVHGVTAGYRPDSVAFELPVSVSNISSANMRSALLSFTYDSTRFPLNGVSADAASGIEIDSVESSPVEAGSRRVYIWMHGVSGVITGADTLLRIAFTGLVGLDTVFDTLTNVSLRPTNADGWIGNTEYLGNPICLEGRAPSNVVMQDNGLQSRLEVYPNPATNAVSIEAPESGEPATITVFDMLGRMTAGWNSGAVQWRIPTSMAPGIYRVICRQQQQTFMRSLVIER